MDDSHSEMAGIKADNDAIHHIVFESENICIQMKRKARTGNLFILFVMFKNIFLRFNYHILKPKL